VQVHAVTRERATDTFVNPVNGQVETLHDRPPLVLRATVDPFGANPGDVIVVVNHLRSFIDIEQVGGEGIRVRAKHTAQAEAIAQLLQDLQQQHPNVPVISVGDYNAEFSDGYPDRSACSRGRHGRPTRSSLSRGSGNTASAEATVTVSK
jgi:predicted extracellular nuclease